MRRGFFGWCVLLGLLGACSSQNEVKLTIYHLETESKVVSEFFEFLPIDHRRVPTATPSAKASEENAKGLRLSLIIDMECVECYQLNREGTHIEVHAGDVLGLQYGIAHALEESGVRFFHPFRTSIPKTLTLRDSAEAYGRVIEPERARRGLHLHTLHPTEGYFAVWEASEENFEHARRIVDWTIKNRGNYLQWIALDNIYNKPEDLPAWRAHTKAILDYLHGRGLEAGIGIQLLSQASLQQGFNLINFRNGEGDERAAINESFDILLEGLQFENISLSFGEFFASDAQRFIDTVDLAYEVLQEKSPGTEMSATIHVGQNEELLVEYDDVIYQYYFLVQFANEAIVPWVHTVMYYNLFEDAGLAYHHEDFSEHRDFLLERLQQEKRVAYHPETAYWVAFDNSVPTYVPLYMRTRWLDLEQIRLVAEAEGTADLDEQILFSTGWEWGYWQNDYAALRSSHTLPATWQEQISQMYSHWGEHGGRLAQALIQLTAAQSTALIDQRLAAYLGGRDVTIDLGRTGDIVSQPDRPSFEEVAALGPDDAAKFRSEVLAPLVVLAEVAEEVSRDIADLDLPREWLEEMQDGVAVTAARTRFAHAMFSAALDYGEGKDVSAWLTEADELLLLARLLVDRRHGNFFYPNAKALTKTIENFTSYQFGYLRQTQDLCYWHRERVEVEILIGASEEIPPTCFFN